MIVLQTKKRGGVVWLACKPHELVVVGSNPAPASISTHRYIPTWVPNSMPIDARDNVISRHRFREVLKWASFLSSVWASLGKIRLFSQALRHVISDVLNVDYSVSVYSLWNVTVVQC